MRIMLPRRQFFKPHKDQWIGRGWKVKKTWAVQVDDQPFTFNDNGQAVLLAKDGSGEIPVPRLSETLSHWGYTNC